MPAPSKLPFLAHERRSAGLAVAAGTLLLAGCVSDPEPQEMARTSLNTAPADLQLLCANAVASSSGVSGDMVLPVASRQLDSKTYQVELDARGAKTSCIIDDEGNVASVEPI